MKLRFFVPALSIFLSGGPATAEVSSIVLSDASLKKLESQEPFSQSESNSEVEAALKELISASDTGSTKKSSISGKEYYQIFDSLDVEMFRLIKAGKIVEKSWDQLTNDEKEDMFDDGRSYSIYLEDTMGAQLGVDAVGVSVKKGNYVVKMLRARTSDMPCINDDEEILGKFVIGSGVAIDIDLTVVRGKVGLTLDDIEDAFGFGWRKVTGSIDTRSIGLKQMPELSSMALKASGDLSEETIAEASEVVKLYANSISLVDIAQPKVLMAVDFKTPGLVRESYLANECNLPAPKS
jgi:hypothetical protein